MKYAIITAAMLIIFGAHIEAATAKKRHGVAISKRCDPPKRWVEVDALADDAGRPSKVVCR